ncbi:MBL fold metallo-hydrolase [Galbibacter orientalis]|nr:MBL fold metallo-hydrolase [Galbibacter orientalis]
MIQILFTILVSFININTVLSKNANYEIYAIKFAEVGSTQPLSGMVLNAPASEQLKPIFMYWLLKGNNGKNIIVDTGFLGDIEQVKTFGIINYVRPDLMLQELGLKASDITDIIVTHPHWGHVGGVSLYPNANVWIQKKDYYYFVTDAWQKNGRGGFNKEDVLKLMKLNIEGKLFFIDGDDKVILPNIKVFTGSRHTFESQYVMVENDKNNIIIASDNVFTYYNLNNLMSAPNHATFDIIAYVKEMERMKTFVKDILFIIPGHDDLFFSKFPKISNHIVRID